MPARRKPAFRPLSESPLWAANRSYYERTGIDAWRTATVPHYVTNNVPLAAAYARIVFAFLNENRSAEKGLDENGHSRRTRLRRARRAGGLGGRPEPPMYIVELGAGCGRFAFLFLRAFEALERGARDAPLSIRYVMTDVTSSTIAFWRAHEALAPFVRAGRLDFARFDAETDGALRLQHARQTIGPDARVARVVVIANYVFDGLRHDAFVVRDGRLHEYLATTDVPRRRGAAADVALQWREGARVRAPYAEADFNAILAEYGRNAGAGRTVFPVGALRCLDRLATLAHDDLLVLAADRGTAEATDALMRPADLEMARHGSVSLPVNFHALRSWVTRRGGRALTPSQEHRHLYITGFLLGTPTNDWRATSLAYREAIGDGGPDELYTFRRGLTAIADQLGAAELVALIRLCGHDPRVVAECIRPLWRHVVDANARLRLEIRDIALAAWASYYHVGEPYDLAFNLALLLYETRAFTDAHALFDESVRLYGDDGATRWNLGLCQVALGKPDEAMASFHRARELAPDLLPAGLKLVKVRDLLLSSAARDSGGRRRRPRAPRR